MLLKITDFPDDLAASLKASTHEATASKAVLAAAYSYAGLLDDVVALNQQVLELQTEVLRLRAVLQGARSAAALLVEKTGQGDLLEPVPFLRKVDHFED